MARPDHGKASPLTVPENVFSALFKACPAAEENYLTEALVFVFKLLLERVPDEGVAMVNRLCGFSHKARLEDPGSIGISTQVIVDEGRPDIEIRSGSDTLVYVEVKHDAPLGANQLEYYWARLEGARQSNTRLVLLTRSRASARETTLAPHKYHHVCWYEIYNWVANTAVQDEVCSYLVRGFMRFLEEKEMSMEKVSWEYIEGIPSLLKLTKMMEASITEAMPGVSHKRTAGWGWRGFNIDGDSFYGVRHENPLFVVFEQKSGSSLTFKRDLALEDMHFFSLSKDEQFECLVEFLRGVSRGASASTGGRGNDVG